MLFFNHLSLLFSHELKSCVLNLTVFCTFLFIDFKFSIFLIWKNIKSFYAVVNWGIIFNIVILVESYWWSRRHYSVKLEKFCLRWFWLLVQFAENSLAKCGIRTINFSAKALINQCDLLADSFINQTFFVYSFFKLDWWVSFYNCSLVFLVSQLWCFCLFSLTGSRLFFTRRYTICWCKVGDPCSASTSWLSCSRAQHALPTWPVCNFFRYQLIPILSLFSAEYPLSKFKLNNYIFILLLFKYLLRNTV